MKPIAQMPAVTRNAIRYVLTDIDDTLTNLGRLTGVAFKAMEHLAEAEIATIAITGRPAGWCDHIARMWPVAAVIGENGAFYFRYDQKQKKMIRRYSKSDEQRAADRKQLEKLEREILLKVPGCRVASDQAYREADLAIDFCEDIPRLSDEDIDLIVDCFRRAGAEAKISSIHINGWFGDYDKLTMTGILFKEIYSCRLEDINEQVIYIGDSPNDEPMFEFFSNSVGVANIEAYLDRLDHKPAWVTSLAGGYGFAEMVDIMLS
jgi:HAD superfamily hydrolase (TIGR01484 family)